MIDAPTVLQTFLLSQSLLTAKVDDRIWRQRLYPIKGWTPSQGAAICFRSRGGPSLDYSGQILTISWTFKCYGVDEEDADQVYRLLFDVLHDAQTGGMYRAAMDTMGQPLEEPILDWSYSLSYWTTLMQAHFEPVI